MKTPKQAMMNRTHTDPIPVQRSRRRHDIRNLTSMPAGKTVPIAVIPLLREDAASLAVNLSFEMQETVEVLMNNVNVDVHVHLVPMLAFERFAGMDDLNNAYAGLPRVEGEPVIPFYEKALAGAHEANEIHYYLGKHHKPTDMVNQAYIETYNAAWNHRAKNISPNITLRDRLETDLAPAFWSHNMFQHIVPDFDDAVMEGEVALTVANGVLPVKGIGLTGTIQSATTNLQVRVSGDAVGTSTTFPYGTIVEGADSALAAGQQLMGVKIRESGIPDIFAELAENGISVTLANIDMARKTQAFANLRKRYSGLNDDMIIDLLMDGITVPEQAWKQPISLGHFKTRFGMAKRYASDGDNLTQSVVNGATGVSFRIATPRVPTGGVIIITAEISPDQLFERLEDPFLHVASTDGSALPQYTPDFLDPQKVDVVTNRMIDIDHDTPDAVFGYAPKHWRWNTAGANIGGRFYRPEVDAGFDEDRQRIWAVETQNPTLSEDFYLTTAMHLKPFVTSNIDPFDCLAVGEGVISGNTVFGGMLIEATNDYDAVLARVDQDRIEK